MKSSFLLSAFYGIRVNFTANMQTHWGPGFRKTTGRREKGKDDVDATAGK